MKPKHTPGPWFVDDKLGHFAYIKASDGTDLAKVDMTNGKELNASLFAAAPELLDAVKAARIAWFGSGLPERLLKLYEDVIRKAECRE